MDPEIEHGVVNWEIENFLLCLPRNNFSSESLRFMFMDSIWFLKLIIQHTENTEREMSLIVELSRGIDSNPESVTARFAVSLKSSNNILETAESEHPFKKGDVVQALQYRTTWQNFWSVYGNESVDYRDVLLIECDIISAKGYPCRSRSREIPVNLMTFLEESHMLQLITKGDNRSVPSYNACLVTEDSDVPVHKEILCACSPAFEDQFQSVDYRLVVPFKLETVEAMLRYMYSGSIEKMIQESLPPIELYDCAVEYQVFDLMKFLSPWKLNITSVVKCRKIKFCFDYMDFTKLLTEQKRVLRRKISEDVEVTIYFSFDREYENLSVKVKLSVKKNTEPVTASGLFHVLDFGGNKLIRRHHLVYLKKGGDCSIDFDINKQNLRAASLMMLGKIFFKMQCEFKLGYSIEPCISEPSDLAYSACLQENLGYYGCVQTGETEMNFYPNNFVFQCGDPSFICPYTNVVLSSPNLAYGAGSM